MADPADFYGTDVLLTDAGDLAVNAAGQLQLLEGPLNCGQAIINRLRTSRGELPLQPDYGSRIADTIVGSHGRDMTVVQSLLNIELRAAFDEDRRFLRAQNISVQQAETAVWAALELVLAAGDVLAIQDATNPDGPSITLAPAEVESLDDSELDEFFGTDEDDEDDLVDVDDLIDDGTADPHGEDT